METLTLARGDGWPQRTSRWLLLAALVTGAGSGGTSGLVAMSGMLLLLALVLRAWRRGLTLERGTATLVRWWGFQLPWAGPVQVRAVEECSLEGLDTVVLEHLPPGLHYKRWAMFRVVLARAGAVWEHLVVDDEFPDLEKARALGEKVAAFLNLSEPQEASLLKA